MSTANATSVTVKIDPTANSQQADIIGPATPTRAGVMTAAQAAKLDELTPGMVGPPGIVADEIAVKHTLIVASVLDQNIYYIPVGNYFLDAASETTLEVDKGAGYVPVTYMTGYQNHAGPLAIATA